MEITIKIAGEEDKAAWNKIVEESAHGTIFHLWEWIKIAEKNIGYKLYPLMGLIDNGNKPVAVYPIFYKKRALIRSVFSPPPKTAMPYLGPVLSEYEELKQNKREGLLFDFQKSVSDFISSEIKPQYISLSTSPGLLDSRPYMWSGYNVWPSYNYTIDLTKGEEEIFKGFTKNLRQTINSTEKKGVAIELGGKKELNEIYRMLVENYTNQGKQLPISYEYVMDIFGTYYPNYMNIFVAKHEGEIIGGMVDVHYKSKAYSWIGNMRNSKSKLDVNELIQWRAIQLGCKEGYKEYEIIGANTPRLSPFKTKFNPDLSVYFAATKYSAQWVKIPEFAYMRILKPIRGKIASRKK